MDWSTTYPWLLPLAIFAARVVDVSLGTVRTILVIRGRWLVAALIGFFEILVWVLAVAQVMRNLDTWYLAVAYAGGFAAGNVVGIWVESKLALGQELVRVISETAQVNLADALREEGLHVLELDGHAEGGRDVEVLFVVAPRRSVPGLLDRIGTLDPRAVCTLSDVKRHTAAMPVAATSAMVKLSRGRMFRGK